MIWNVRQCQCVTNIWFFNKYEYYAILGMSWRQKYEMHCFLTIVHRVQTWMCQLVSVVFVPPPPAPWLDGHVKIDIFPKVEQGFKSDAGHIPIPHGISQSRAPVCLHCPIYINKAKNISHELSWLKYVCYRKMNPRSTTSASASSTATYGRRECYRFVSGHQKYINIHKLLLTNEWMSPGPCTFCRLISPRR